MVERRVHIEHRLQVSSIVPKSDRGESAWLEFRSQKIIVIALFAGGEQGGMLYLAANDAARGSEYDDR